MNKTKFRANHSYLLFGDKNDTLDYVYLWNKNDTMVFHLPNVYFDRLSHWAMQLMNIFQKNYDMLLAIFNPEGWLEITYPFGVAECYSTLD